MAINLASKYESTIDKAFTKSCILKQHCKGKMDFTGVKTVKIYGLDPVKEGDYKREGNNRYGEPQELQDTVEEHTLSQDKAFTLTIDKGNNLDQMNIKGAAEVLRMQIDEESTPNADKYGFKRLCAFGHTAKLTQKPTKTTIVDVIADGMVFMDDKLVPSSGRVLFVTSEMYKLLLLSDEFIKLDGIGSKALPKGTVGEILGMSVVKVPESYLPSGCFFLILWERAACFPYKIQDAKIHQDSPGVSGSLIEGRHYYDVFVFQKKSNGIYAGVLADNKLATPTITATTKTATTITCANAESVYYTLDGTDPRTSASKMGYAGPFDATGKTVRAVGMCDRTYSKFTSDIAEVTVS